MKTVRVIKEPIHDYIAISELEHKLINDPLFLRLQHISQNGLAYLTYPSNRTSRFIHSLGTMHVGGEMIRSALQTSDRKERRDFLSAFGRVMEEAATNVSTRKKQIQEFLSKQSDIFYRHAGFNPQSPRDMPAIVMFQALRIACVMHDLGHPPFSHSTEMVLQSKLASLELTKAPREYKKFGQILSSLRQAEPGQLHEKIGRELTSYVFSDVGDEYTLFGKFCFWIANRIAAPETASKDPKGVLACLHSIVSGESIDADRCDYVLRDGYASSFEFGDYDLTRILHNLRLSRNRRGIFEIVSTTTAASALESFFLERYRIWRWIVFHPNVVRAELALSRALAILLETAFADRPSDAKEKLIRQILDSWNFAALWRSFRSPEHYREYISCDEPWLLALLREIQNKRQLTGWLPRRVTMLKVYLDFILERKKSNFVTLWKRAEEYEEFAKAISQGAENYESKLSKAKLKLENERATEWLNRVLQAVLEKDLEKGQVECMRRLEAKFQERLDEEGVKGALLAKVLGFKPFKRCLVVDKAGKKVSLTDLSTVVENLPATWRKDIQFRAYWIGLQRNGKLCSPDHKSAAPSRNQLAKCFLPVLLDEKEWYNLALILSDKESPVGKDSKTTEH